MEEEGGSAKGEEEGRKDVRRKEGRREESERIGREEEEDSLTISTPAPSAWLASISCVFAVM